MFAWKASAPVEYRCAPGKRLRLLFQSDVLFSGSPDWIQRYIAPEISEKRDVDVGWPYRAMIRAKELRSSYSLLLVRLCCFFPVLAKDK